MTPVWRKFVWWLQSRRKEAEPSLAESIGMYRKIYPGGHPRLAQCLSNLGTLRVYLVIAGGAAVLFAVQRALDPGVIFALVLALGVSAVVVALTRTSLRIGETFPELLRFRILKWVFR